MSSSSSASSLTKNELIELLECAKNSKEQNKAVKLLKKYPAVRNLEWDKYGKKENLTLKSYDYIKAFMCPRSGQVKQTKTVAIWQFKDDTNKHHRKTICTTCYQQLTEGQEVSILVYVLLK